MVLHGLQDGINGLLAKIIVSAAVEGIRLVDKQDAAQGFFHDFRGFQRRLAHIACHQTAAVHLNQLSLGQDAQASVDAGHQPRDCGFAGARIAGEDHVQRQILVGQIFGLPQLIDLHQIDEGADFPLDVLQAHIAVQLFQQVLYVFRRRLLFFFFWNRLFGFLRLLIRRRRSRRIRFGRMLWSPPEISLHGAEIALGHRPNHIHLPQNDLIFFVMLFSHSLPPL